MYHGTRTSNSNICIYECTLFWYLTSEFLTFLLHRRSWAIQIQVHPCHLRVAAARIWGSDKADLRRPHVDGRITETDRDWWWRLEGGQLMPRDLDGGWIHRVTSGHLALLRECAVALVRSRRRSCLWGLGLVKVLCLVLVISDNT
jgi:hypothetical protein